MSALMNTTINTGDLSIDRVLSTGRPVALIFVAGMTPPALETTMNRLITKHPDRLIIAKVDTRDNPETVRRYQIGATPALVTIENQEVKTKAEVISAHDFATHIAYLLGEGPKPITIPLQDNQPESKPFAVTAATFEQEVMKSSLPVAVDFWAPWCGPCRMIEPALNNIALEMAGSVRIAKVNVDENPSLSNDWSIMGIPTMMIVKNGQIVDRWSGALAEATLRMRIEQSCV